MVKAIDDKSVAAQLAPGFGDYWAILKRRKRAFLIPFAITLYISLLLAFGLPSVYRSQSTILIERQEIPTALVETTVTGFVQERIETIKQRLMSPDRLWEIAEKLNLYPDMRSEVERQKVIELMRDNIHVEMVDIKTNQAGSPREGIATVAFTVAFEDESPQTAQMVAAELTELYMSENRKRRGEQAAEVSSFLEKEVQRLAKEMEESERRLADFKKEHLGATPELSDLNMRLLEQTENKIQRLDDRIRSFEDRRMSLESQLSITSPYKDVFTDEGARVQTPGERLSTLTSEYLRLSATYAQNHPDVVKLRREITALENQTGLNSGASSLVAKLSRQREELAKARSRYSAEHPDVKKLQQSVASLERELRNIVVDRSASVITAPAKPDNPTYISLQTQLNSVLASIAADQATRAKLEQKLAKYESRLASTPAVERDFLALNRDYDNARKKYQEIKDKLLEARMAEQLEAGGKAERFTLISRPRVPVIPEKPDRVGIALLGSVLAFVFGLAGVTVKEYSDRSVRGSKGVLSISHAPPLVSIPYIENDEDRRRGRIRRWRTFINWSVVLLLASAGLLLLFLYKQCDDSACLKTYFEPAALSGSSSGEEGQ